MAEIDPKTTIIPANSRIGSALRVISRQLRLSRGGDPVAEGKRNDLIGREKRALRRKRWRQKGRKRGKRCREIVLPKMEIPAGIYFMCLRRENEEETKSPRNGHQLSEFSRGKRVREKKNLIGRDMAGIRVGKGARAGKRGNC